MSTTTGTAGDDAWVVVSAGTFTLNGAAGIDTLFLGTSLASDYRVSTASDGVHVDSISAASSPLHATLQNMEVLVYNTGHDYQGIGNLNVAFLDGSKSSLNANTSRSASNFTISQTSTGYSALAKDGLGLFTFNNIQRIQFSDKNIALDLSTTGNAALVAETLGAVLGGLVSEQHQLCGHWFEVCGRRHGHQCQSKISGCDAVGLGCGAWRQPNACPSGGHPLHERGGLTPHSGPGRSFCGAIGQWQFDPSRLGGDGRSTEFELEQHQFDWVAKQWLGLYRLRIVSVLF